jgi:hypothetical protein
MMAQPYYRANRKIIHRNFSLCPSQNAWNSKRLIAMLRVFIEAAKKLSFSDAFSHTGFTGKVPS